MLVAADVELLLWTQQQDKQDNIKSTKKKKLEVETENENEK